MPPEKELTVEVIICLVLETVLPGTTCAVHALRSTAGKRSRR
jgi:hypothetical protein